MYELLIFVFWVLLSEPPFRIIFVIDIINILTFSTQAALRAHCTLGSARAMRVCVLHWSIRVRVYDVGTSAVRTSYDVA